MKLKNSNLWREDWHRGRYTALPFSIGIVVRGEEIGDFLPEAPLRGAEVRHGLHPQPFVIHIQLRLHPRRPRTVLGSLPKILGEDFSVKIYFLFVEYSSPVSRPGGRVPLYPSCDLKSTNASNIPVQWTMSTSISWKPVFIVH